MWIFSPDVFKSPEHCLWCLCSQHEWTCMLVLFVLTSMIVTLTLTLTLALLQKRAVKVQVQKFSDLF